MSSSEHGKGTLSARRIQRFDAGRHVSVAWAHKQGEGNATNSWWWFQQKVSARVSSPEHNRRVFHGARGGGLAGFGMLVGLAGFLSQPAKGLVGILGLVLTAAVVITYLAEAEMIKLAIYVARLLEEIRDSLRD